MPLQFVTAASEKHESMGGLSLSSCFLWCCSCMCLKMPAWSLGGISKGCMRSALALLQLEVTAVTSAEMCGEKD